MLRAICVLVPIGIIFSANAAFASEATLSFSGTVLPACQLAAPDQATALNPTNSPEVMVLRCNHGAEFQVVPIGSMLKRHKAAIEEANPFVQNGLVGDRMSLNWAASNAKLDSEEQSESAYMFTVVP